MILLLCNHFQLLENQTTFFVAQGIFSAGTSSSTCAGSYPIYIDGGYGMSLSIAGEISGLYSSTLFNPVSPPYVNIT